MNISLGPKKLDYTNMEEIRSNYKCQICHEKYETLEDYNDHRDENYHIMCQDIYLKNQMKIAMKIDINGLDAIFYEVDVCKEVS